MDSLKNQIESILREAGEDTLRVMDHKVSNEIKQVYSEEIEYMYSEYQPKTYRRRRDRKGFLDEVNWDVDVELLDDGSIQYTLVNETETLKPSSMRLDMMIEEGQVHDTIAARPVYERTMNRLKDENIIENILESELKKQGWDFK